MRYLKTCGTSIRMDPVVPLTGALMFAAFNQ